MPFASWLGAALGAERARIARALGQAAPALACAFALVTNDPSSAETEDEHARIAAVTQPTQDFSKPEPYERRPTGAATVFKPLMSIGFED